MEEAPWATILQPSPANESLSLLPFIAVGSQAIWCDYKKPWLNGFPKVAYKIAVIFRVSSRIYLDVKL